MKPTKSELTEYQVVIGNLKRLFKEQKVSYKNLADQVKLSESGIKKIFSAKDGSFQRLHQFCQVAGVSIYEMLQDSKSVDVTFSKKQQDEFLEDFNLFRVYWMLVYERASAESVQQKLNLNYKEYFHRLRKLDNLKLLKLLPNDRLHLPSIKAVRWVGQGDFVTKLYKSWAKEFFESVAKPNSRPDECFILRYLLMTQNTYKEFRLALANLEEEFIRRSIHEMRTKGSEVHHVRWMVLADNRSFIGNTHV